MENLLNILYELTLIENVRQLTSQESDFYVYCYQTLRDNNIEIPFGITI